MKKGDKITSVLPAANYDPTVFDNPREINFKRPRKPMLAFAGGVHSCMGAHLARLEMRICISEFLRRIPNFQLKDGFKVEYYAGGVVGPKKLPQTRPEERRVGHECVGRCRARWSPSHA